MSTLGNQLVYGQRLIFPALVVMLARSFPGFLLKTVDAFREFSGVSHHRDRLSQAASTGDSGSLVVRIAEPSRSYWLMTPRNPPSGSGLRPRFAAGGVAQLWLQQTASLFLFCKNSSDFVSLMTGSLWSPIRKYSLYNVPLWNSLHGRRIILSGSINTAPYYLPRQVLDRIVQEHG